jgi:hypothetical protein
MTVKTLREGVSKFTTPKYPKIQRSPAQVKAKTAMAEELMAHFRDRYNSLAEQEDKRFLRDLIDFQMRRYQGYAVEAEMGAHYKTATASNLSVKKIFEHVLPLCRGRDMLIGGQLTPLQALHIPTCLVTPEQDKLITGAGRVSHSDNYWLIFSRYDCFDDVILTHDGLAIDPKTWTLADHYKHFKIKV